jgi:CubicO group peptidase (beta-lactamase class C family)
MGIAHHGQRPVFGSMLGRPSKLPAKYGSPQSGRLLGENPGRREGVGEIWSYGYGISQIIFGPNSVYFHGGEMPGYNSFMGYDPLNDVTLIIWTSLTISLDGQPTANTIMLKMLDQIYTASPLH